MASATAFSQFPLIFTRSGSGPGRARHPKGIGSKAAAINDYLEGLGFDPSDVYDNPRTAAGRVWKPGPKLHDALKAAQHAG